MKAAEIPTDTQLLLLCRDYLLDLRRNNDETALAAKNNMDADYISLAIFSLNRSILRPDYLANTKQPEDIFASSSKSSNSHRIPQMTNRQLSVVADDFVRIQHMLGIKDVLDLLKRSVQRSVLRPNKCRAGKSVPVFATDRATHRFDMSVQVASNGFDLFAMARPRNRQHGTQV